MIITYFYDDDDVRFFVAMPKVYEPLNRFTQRYGNGKQRNT